jgi:hypothetical protein
MQSLQAILLESIAMNSLRLALLAGVGLMTATAQTQSALAQADYSNIQVSNWQTQRSDTVDYDQKVYLGKSAFIMTRKYGSPKGASLAYPKDLDFTDGTIDLDIAAPSGLNGFVGIAFHIQDSNHYETLYFRPGSSGTGYAVQYMPKKKAEFNWWDYEYLSWQATATLPDSDWFHVQVVVQGRDMKVYLNHQTIPVMVRTDLDPSLPHGSVGFWLGNCSAGAYRNLKVKKTA